MLPGQQQQFSYGGGGAPSAPYGHQTLPGGNGHSAMLAGGGAAAVGMPAAQQQQQQGVGVTTGAGASAGLPKVEGAASQYLFKFIIVGDEGVGKTCLLLQFTDKRYRTKHEVTIGVEFGSRSVQIQGKDVKLQCWDTAGQDRFRSIVKSYYRGSAAALLVYDITSRSSFQHVANWLSEAQEHSDPNLIITLVGNKCDKTEDRQVSYQEGFEFAQRYNLQFVETSAVTGENVDDTFIQTANIVYMKNVASGVLEPPVPAQPPIRLSAQGVGHGGGGGGFDDDDEPTDTPCGC